MKQEILKSHEARVALVPQSGLEAGDFSCGRGFLRESLSSSIMGKLCVGNQGWCPSQPVPLECPGRPGPERGPVTSVCRAACLWVCWEGGGGGSQCTRAVQAVGMHPAAHTQRRTDAAV